MPRLDYDAQAFRYDRRTGPPDEASALIAAALCDLAPAGARTLLDLGAGTGAIGRHLARAFPGYLGLDASRGMLAEFRSKAQARIVVADADEPWPLRDRSLDVVFASRSAHLLAPDHLVGELLRVLRPGGLFALGRVARPPDGVRTQLRARLHELLARRGLAARDGAGAGRALQTAPRARGAGPPTVHTVAGWDAVEVPRTALADWRGKQGLAGERLDPTVQREVLDELETWARERFGDLDTGRIARQTYEITVQTAPAAR